MKAMKSLGIGLVTGAVIGSVAGLMIDPGKKTKKNLKLANGVFSSIGTMIANMIRVKESGHFKR